MSGARLHTLLPELTTRQPVMVVGAAVIDVIADAYALPWRGCDIELKQQSVNVGGCALNIAVALKRLGIEAGNALPLGQGVWAEIAAERFALSAEITTLGKQWQEKFAAPLIVRLDKEGAWYFSNDASGCIPAFPTQVVDTIGAGDSHAGGVLAGLASGLPLADAVLLGNAVASWVVGHRGGDCAPTREELLLAHKNV
ncbi:TPA: hypothetical protein QHP98_002690 [Escherichia coli]|nr:hypothetical protein [Escherichia coli]